MAITDDGISDEMLLDELEKMRTVEKMWQCEWRKPNHQQDTDAHSPISCSAEEEEDDMAPTLKPSLPCLSDPALSAVWQSARRALLICREFVRTERHYLAGLRTLALCETSTLPPPLMLTYLPALVQASEALMTKMERNPSAQGVASAFLSVGDQLETALVSWCGVVGGFFVDSGAGSPPERTHSALRSQKSAPEEKSVKKRTNSWGKRINSIKALATSTPPSPVHGVRSSSRAPAVRDLAILPTQRLMRYALLFKGLSANPLCTFCPLTINQIFSHIHPPIILLPQTLRGRCYSLCLLLRSVTGRRTTPHF